MTNEFDDVMRSRTDAELISIIEGPLDNYQPSAFESAKNEFKRRGLSEMQINTVKKQIKEKSEVDGAKANEPLSTIYKVLSIIFPGAMQIMFAGTLKIDGYERKSRELVRWTLYGFFCYVGLFLFFMILDGLYRHFIAPF